MVRYKPIKPVGKSKDELRDMLKKAIENTEKKEKEKELSNDE